MFLSKDERLEKLEKRINEMERNINKRFNDMESSFRLFKNVLKRMQSEKSSLEKDRDFLIEKQKEALRRLSFSGQNVIAPLRNEFEDLVNDVRKLGKEFTNK